MTQPKNTPPEQALNRHPQGAFSRKAFGSASTAEEVTQGLDLTGQTILLTGCNSGLGQESLRVLHLRGAQIYAAARTLEKAQAASAPYSSSSRVLPVACDLADPASILRLVDALKAKNVQLDVILCNAGVMALPKRQEIAGVELQFFTNHFGHFLLVTRLLDHLSPGARIVLISSQAHRMAPAGGINFSHLTQKAGYRPWTAYGQSKMANLLFCSHLALKLRGTGKTVNAVHPGVILTPLWRHMPGLVGWIMNRIAPLFLKTISQGAATGVFVAVHPQAAGVSGKYWMDCQVAKARKEATDPQLAQQLWQFSEDLAAASTPPS